MASVYDKFNQQPAAVKVMVVAGLGLAGYAAYRAIKKNADESKARKAAEAAGGEIAQYNNAGYHATYSDSEYYSFANTLVQSMDGCGTDEDMILEVFRKMRNPVDIRKLIIAFGVQYYQPCAASQPLSYLRWQFDSQAYGGDLATWLSYDLSTGYIQEINQILSERGTEFQF